jgi:hypothetical protein
MFAFVDGEGKIVYEKICDEDDEENNDKDEENEEEEKMEEEEKDETEEEEKEEEKMAEEEKEENLKQPVSMKSQSDPRKITSSSVMVLNETTNTPEAVQRTEPLPRINAATLVHGHVLYVLGGILEVGDREVTLDDMWSLDLRKRDKWECLWKGTMHKQVWRGAIHDDDDSYISTGKEDGSDDESDDEDDFSEDEDEDTAKLKKSSKQKRAGLRHEVAELNEKYGLDDLNRTPNSGETLADFYSRTSDYWNAEAAVEVEGTSDELSKKELKRKGFSLAKERYDDLEPVLSRLADLGIGENQNRDRNRDPKEKKEKKKKSSKR